MNKELLSDSLNLIDDHYIIEAAQIRPHTVRRGALLLRRTTALAAAVVLCLCTALPVLAAANVEVAYALLYFLSPALAQQMKPVNLSCEDNGIRVEVISANISDDFPLVDGTSKDTANVLIALTDLTGDRIDETVDLFDSYFINTPFDSAATCRLIEYDADTHTATFLLSITHMKGEPIDDEKITLTLQRFISGKRTFSGTMPEIDLSVVSLFPATQTKVSLRSMPFENDTAYLLPGDAPLFSPMDGVNITAMGFIDEKLHVQAHCADILTLDTNGYLTLYTAENTRITPINQVSFWDDARTGSYEEFIFDVSPQVLAGAKLFGFFTSADTHVEGNWSVTFPLS